MKLVERHIVKGAQFYDLCVRAKNLYNQSLYYWRQSMFGNIQYFTEYELTGLFAQFKEESYGALPAQTSQQIIKLLFKNIKSWQQARKEWEINPCKFLGRPKIPKYKKEVSIAVFTGQQVKIKAGNIHFPKAESLQPIKTKVDNIYQVRVVPHSAIVAKTAYKGLLDGIEVLKTQEAYTSKCSALDLEPIRKHETYIGNRKKRGLFVTSTGFLVNADHNGALNIARLGVNASGNQIPVWELVSSAALAPIPIAVL